MKTFYIYISGDIEASSLEEAYGKVADFFYARSTDEDSLEPFLITGTWFMKERDEKGNFIDG
jgi:hypothetical protein